MRCVLLAVLLAAVGCLPSRGRDEGAPSPVFTWVNRDLRRPARIVVEGYGAPVAYAGPVAAGPPRVPDRRGGRPARGTCTAVTIRLPGVIVYHGDLGPVLAAVETSLPPGEYSMYYKRTGGPATITPWADEDLVLAVTLADEGWKVQVFQAYLDSMTAPVPLRVLAASPAGAAGDGCHACVHLAPGAEDRDTGQALIQALSQDLPQAERGYWARWAAALASQVARARDQASPREQIETLLATGGSRTLPAWRSARAARDDPQWRKSWQALAAWEQALWRAYLDQHGDTMDVSDPARRDLHVTAAVRFSMALRLSPQYMAPGMREAAAHLFNDPMFLGGTVLGLSAYLALFVVPEPVVSKAVAVLTTIALVSLAGFTAAELLTLAQAWMRLRDDTAAATTLPALEAAAERFGRTIGGSAVRILAVLATVYVGTRLPSTPPPGAPAAATLRVMPAPGGGVHVVAGGAAVLPMGGTMELGWAVQIVRNGAVILMATSAAGGGPGPGPATAPSQGRGAAAQGSGTSANKPSSKPGKSSSMRVETTGAAFTPHPTIEGIREPGPIRSFTSHKAFTRSMGKAGEGKQWHHIVEQTPGNVAQFESRAIHSTANVIRIDVKIHRKINEHYSSNKQGTNMTVRKWLSTQSFEKQQEYGIMILRQHGVIP